MGSKSNTRTALKQSTESTFKCLLTKFLFFSATMAQESQQRSQCWADCLVTQREMSIFSALICSVKWTKSERRWACAPNMTSCLICSLLLNIWISSMTSRVPTSLARKRKLICYSMTSVWRIRKMRRLKHFRAATNVSFHCQLLSVVTQSSCSLTSQLLVWTSKLDASFGTCFVNIRRTG